MVAQTRGRQHEDAFDRSACDQLGGDKPRLNGLAEADLVGQQQPRSRTSNDGERRLELMRQQVDARRRRCAKRARRGVCRNGGATGPDRGEEVEVEDLLPGLVVVLEERP